MRLFIAVLVLIFSLQSWTKAEDISEFEIEGMSIGDSLLDYLDKTHIQENKYFAVKKFTKFASIFYQKNLENYEIGAISAFVKIKDTEDCKIKKKKIVKSISSLFLNTKSYENTKPYFQDPNTLVYSTVWNLDKGGFLRVACYDWTKESGSPKELRIDAANAEYKLFLDTVK